jgi:hypothetical protein
MGRTGRFANPPTIFPVAGRCLCLWLEFVGVPVDEHEALIYEQGPVVRAQALDVASLRSSRGRGAGSGSAASSPSRQMRLMRLSLPEREISYLVAGVR